MRTALILLAMTGAAFFLHGYHPGAEDAEIYLPGVIKILHPDLFPRFGEFFQSHAHLTLFPNLMAASVRVSHLPLDAVSLLWELASIFLLLLGCWQLSGLCFPGNDAARWAGVALIGALLTLPVAGTALYIVDQYTNPRNLAAFAGIFAVTAALRKRYVVCVLWVVAAAAVHPLMSVFAFSLCFLIVVMDWLNWGTVGMLAISPISFLFAPTSPAYHQAALQHPYHYLRNWEWYEWLGIFGPLILLWWFGKIAASRRQRELTLLCRALLVYGVVYFVAAVVLSVPASFEAIARLQATRSLHLVYIVLFLLIGGFIGEKWLKNRTLRWLVFFAPICAGMLAAQLALFPASRHVEWTRAGSQNLWAQAFNWARENTPPDAVFALDPYYPERPGEDAQGFRAIAERSMLADAGKDSGAVSMFPALADEWYSQVQARKTWKQFQAADFARLQYQYGINWVVVEQPGVVGLDCPYRNQAVLVCRLP
jgi:hypothetical protein